jgi:hypothetical protein
MTLMHSVLLSQLQQKPPAMVTVCRSGRDGYIPGHLWQGIEDGVLGMVTDLSDVWQHGLNVTYDRDCFWGPKGRPSRSILPVASFLEREGVATSGQWPGHHTSEVMSSYEWLLHLEKKNFTAEF